MKKVVIALLLIIPIIGVNTVNNKNYELETVTNTYTKEEIDSKLEEIRTSINNNKTSIEENKNILTTIQNKLNDYALKTALNETNSNIDSLNTIVTNNTNKITTIENGKTLIAESITNKGITTSSTDSFETMANNINSISTVSETTLQALLANSTSGQAIARIKNNGWKKATITTYNNSGYNLTAKINGTVVSLNSVVDISNADEIELRLISTSSASDAVQNVTALLN